MTAIPAVEGCVPSLLHCLILPSPAREAGCLISPISCDASWVPCTSCAFPLKKSAHAVLSSAACRKFGYLARFSRDVGYHGARSASFQSVETKIVKERRMRDASQICGHARVFWESCFVSGHDFSRAVKTRQKSGLLAPALFFLQNVSGQAFRAGCAIAGAKAQFSFNPLRPD
jgi:hypothetical protein